MVEKIDFKAAGAVVALSTLGALGGGKFTRGGLALLAAHDLFVKDHKNDSQADKNRRLLTDGLVLLESASFYRGALTTTSDSFAPADELKSAPKLVDETRATASAGYDAANNEIRLKPIHAPDFKESFKRHEMQHANMHRFITNNFGMKAFRNHVAQYKTITGKAWTELFTELRSLNLFKGSARTKLVSAGFIAAWAAVYGALTYTTQYPLLKNLFGSK